MEKQTVRLAAFDTLDSAYIAMGMLETNGIECSLVNGVISSVYPLGWASPEILVNVSQAAEARQMMIDGGLDKYLL